MKLSKTDRVLNTIIYSITHGKKESGDYIFAREYNLSSMLMSALFKILKDNDIIYQDKNNGYILTNNCVENAQELYFAKVVEAVNYVKLLADTANISHDVLMDIFREETR